MKKYIVFLFLLASCVYPYDFIPYGIEKLLVVDGFISNDLGNSEIKLSYSNEFNAKVFDKVNNAKVEVIENSSVIHSFINNAPGLYVPADTMFKADFQKIYKLHVEIGNRIYESNEVNITKAAEIESVSFKGADKYRAGDKQEYRALDISVTTKNDIEASKYYRYSAEETWLVVANESNNRIYKPVFINDQTGNPIDIAWNDSSALTTECWASSVTKGIVTAGTEGLTRNQLVNIPVFAVSLESPKLLYKYSVLVKQYSIPKEAYHFLTLMREFSDKSGSLFDIQPGFVDGNIISLSDENEKVVGIFYATDIEESRIFIRYQDLIPSDQLIVAYYDQYCAHETVSIPSSPDSAKTASLIFLRDSLIYGKGLSVVDLMIIVGTDTTEMPVLTNAPCADCRQSGTNVRPRWWGDIYL
jgi:hypothetical protein